MFTEAAYSIRNRRRTKMMRVLVTGAAGSIGETVVAVLRKRPDMLVFATDIAASDKELDVTDREAVERWVATVRPSHILHLAGAKHAPEGELDPAGTFRVNTVGTENILRAARNAKVILASTCKACDPETAYGASKLIAERMVLNAGGVVVRYFNVKESSGNVFRIWEHIPAADPLPVTRCWRYFIGIDAAVELTVAALDLPSGRYAVDPGQPCFMFDVAAREYPGRELREIVPRRGDREQEPLKAACETIVRQGSFLQIVSPYDP